MPSVYDGWVKCPFYIRLAEQSITCEGITDDCVLKTIFKSKKEKTQHLKIFCCNKYKNCEIHQMLEKKYEDEL